MRLNKYLFWFIISACPDLQAQSENFLFITGTVVDDETGNPLPYASIGMSHHAIGTISNNLGEFILNVPERFEKDTLMVSYLGYTKYAAVISDVKKTNLIIRLKSSAMLLSEVSVYGTKLTAKEIIERAIHSIKENYPINAFKLEGFYRDILKENERYVALTEAALDIFDKNFQRKLNHGITEQVIIKEARKSINYSDHLIQRIRKQNGIVDLLDNNPVHYPRGLLTTKYFDYQIDSIFQSQDDIIYIISTIPGNHRIYVADDSYAIIKTVEEIKESDSFNRPEFVFSDSLIVHRMIYFKAITEFQKYNGKMYLRYSNETDSYEVLHKTSRKRKFLIESYKEIVVTNIIDTNPDPFDKKLIFNFKDEIVSKDYNAAFWDNTSSIQLSPLNPQVTKDLEVELSLKDQFEKH